MKVLVYISLLLSLSSCGLKFSQETEGEGLVTPNVAGNSFSQKVGATVNELPGIGSYEVSFTRIDGLSAEVRRVNVESEQGLAVFFTGSTLSDSSVESGSTYRYEFFNESDHALEGFVELQVPLDIVVDPEATMLLPEGRAELNRVRLEKNSTLILGEPLSSLRIKTVESIDGTLMRIEPSTAEPSRNGLSLDDLHLEVGDVLGKLKIVMNSGNGGVGATGNQGSTGEKGAPGRSMVTRRLGYHYGHGGQNLYFFCEASSYRFVMSQSIVQEFRDTLTINNPLRGGPGGPGGIGGTGGTGGKGGSTGNLYLDVPPEDFESRAVEVEFRPGVGGEGGAGGPGGPGGPGGVGGRGLAPDNSGHRCDYVGPAGEIGPPGAKGVRGPIGSPGLAGKLILNGAAEVER